MYSSHLRLSKICVSNINIIILKGFKDCALLRGDMNSEYEEFLKDTNSAVECSRQVHALRPSAVGMTWAANSRNCYAEIGSSEAVTTDSFGCLSCKTCSFSE